MNGFRGGSIPPAPTHKTKGKTMNKLNKEDLLLIKKALKICIIKFSFRYEKVNDIDSKILANKFHKVTEKIKNIEV